ncbi:MAG: HAMP domain-containing histidine kinase [Chloroflexi bacterium]|nr:MAG: HAMP domain-containing histidine kinase [Chloroflexota bacterium]
MNPPIGDGAPVARRLAPIRHSVDRLSQWVDDRTAFRRRIPIRGRIALFGAAVVAVTVVMFSVLVYVVVENSLVSQQDGTLSRGGDRNWSILQFGGRFVPSRNQFQTDLKTSSEPFYEVFDSQGTALGSSAFIDGIYPQFSSGLFDSVGTDRGRFKTVQATDGPLVRAYVRAWNRPDFGNSGYLLYGQPIGGIEAQLESLRLFLIAGGILSLLGAGLASWLVAGRALRPLDAMASTAEDIGRTQDLGRRLPEGGPNDEVGRLQRSFNQMLRQLEDAYQRLRSALMVQRRFVADASHELRTPLTTIRGNVGLLLKRDDITGEDRMAALNDIAGESERMSRMVQDLLTLARADAGYHLEKAPIDLLPIVQDVARQAHTLRPLRRIELLDGAPAPVHGNADAIRQLLWILIDNAMNHTNPDGRIQVRLVPGSGAATLVVSDDGPGIPRQDLERIFERFYQSDASRSGEGTGLGLAIARWIAQEHGGRVFAANNPQGGAAFTVELPTPQTLASH